MLGRTVAAGVVSIAILQGLVSSAAGQAAAKAPAAGVPASKAPAGKAPTAKAPASVAPAAAPAVGKTAPATPPAGTPAAPEVVPTSVVAKHRKAVFDAYVQAARAADWKKASGLFDPTALDNLHTLMTKILNAAAAKGEEKELLRLFGGAPNAEVFAKQSPAETFAAFMSGMSQSAPALKDAIATAQFQYLGEVPENENLVHIVYRTRVKVGGIESSKVTASSMTKTTNGWRLLLDDEVESFAKMLEQQVAGSEAPPQ